MPEKIVEIETSAGKMETFITYLNKTARLPAWFFTWTFGVFGRNFTTLRAASRR